LTRAFLATFFQMDNLYNRDYMDLS